MKAWTYITQGKLTPEKGRNNFTPWNKSKI